MSAFLNGLGHQLFVWLDLLSIELAALAVLVLVAGHLVESPALRHLLWLAVLVKPVAAVVVSSPYTVFAPLAAFVQPGWDALPAWRVEHLTLTPLPAAPAAFATSSVPFTPAAWGALLWLVGATLLTGRIVLGFGILRRLRRQALVQRDGPLFEALASACGFRLPFQGRGGDLSLHSFAHGPRHPQTAHRRSRRSRAETAG